MVRVINGWLLSKEVVVSSPTSGHAEGLMQHFGREGMRWLGRGNLLGSDLPADAAEVLAEVGLPRVLS
jgi:hypothetical protein